MSVELKIKSKHLSVESKIIRFEEQKCIKQFRYNINKFKETGHNGEYELFKDNSFITYRSLRDHRKKVVGVENRATFLARAFIAGVPYEQVEFKRKPEKEGEFVQLVLPRVYSMVLRYHLKNDSTMYEYDKASMKKKPSAKLTRLINEWVGLQHPDYRQMGITSENTSKTPLNY